MKIDSGVGIGLSSTSISARQHQQVSHTGRKGYVESLDLGVHQFQHEQAAATVGVQWAARGTEEEKFWLRAL